MHRESYFTAGLLSWHLRWFRKPDNNNVAVTKENMVHPGGFEPPTARFVAEYSIQLSYGCIGKAILLRGYSPGTYDGFANQITTMLLLLRRIWCIREDYSAAPRPTGRCLRNVILPGAGDNFSDHKTTSSLLSRRIWCIREDSNLRPLGS